MELPFLPNHNFTGRKTELESIHGAFESLKPDLRKVVVLHGLGGIGKTQLAVQYAHFIHHNYTSVSWINATNSETISGSFLKIAQQLLTQHGLNETTFGKNPDYAAIATGLGIPPNTVNPSGQITASDTATDVIEAVKRWFCTKDNPRWLLIVDNYDDIQNIDIRDYLPHCFHGHILVTSRARDSSRLGQGLEVVEVEPDDGLEILRKSAQYDPAIFKHGG
jgi:hypothetical protein